MMISDLPQDLESEILSRVPATTLRQLRSTCKRWYALFKDTTFVKKNLGKAAAQLILKRGRKVYSCNINLHGIHNSFDPTFEITGTLNSLKDSKRVEVFEIFHCDGLLLTSTLYGDRLVVWNPCTGQTRRIKSNKHCVARCNYFLGYENKKKYCDSYKILSFSYIIYIEDQKDVAVTKIGIYEFNSDSWRVLDEVICERDWYYTYYLSGPVSLKGNTYWYDGNYRKYHPVSSIVVFDYTTERFGRLSLPLKSDGDETVVLSAVREEKLALLRFDKLSLEMKIWVTNTKIDEANVSYARPHLLSYVPSLVHIQQLDAKEKFSRFKITL